MSAEGCFELAGEDILSFTVVLHNSGKESIQLADLYLDIPATGVYTDRGTIFYDADDYYISHPIQNCGGSSLLVMPYGETQLELCEARCEDGVYRLCGGILPALLCCPQENLPSGNSFWQ